MPCSCSRSPRLATLIWDIVADGAGDGVVGLHHQLLVATRVAGRHLARADRQHLRDHRADGAARACRSVWPRRSTSRNAAGAAWPRASSSSNIANLAAVPSIIYGLLGLGLFVRMMGMGRKRAGRRLDARAARAAGRDPRRRARRCAAVPRSLREGSYALGATKWQTIWHQVLPVALPGESDRADPGAVARDRRDGAAHHHRRAHVRHVRARLRSGRSSPCCRFKSSTGCRGRRWSFTPTRPPASWCSLALLLTHERRRDLAARSLPEARHAHEHGATRPLSSARRARHAEQGRQQRRSNARCKIDVDALNFYYGDKRALRGHLDSRSSRTW